MNTDPGAAGHTAAAPEPGTSKDPTSNVLALVTAAIERLDALRDAESARVNQNALYETRRGDDLRALLLENLKNTATHLGATEQLRAEYQEKLATAEAKRIDAIRAVDVAAVAVASERATQQAQVLANQVAASADALRALVATTATTFASQQQSLQTQITERLALLERSQYESKGRAGVEDPRLQDLLGEVKALSATTARGSGKSDGIGASWAVLAAVAAIIISAGSAVLSARGSGATAPTATPPVIYVQPGPSTAAPIVMQPQGK